MKLVYNDITSLNAEWLEPWWAEHFDLVRWDPGLTYNKKDTVIYADYRNTGWARPFQQQGYRVIVDHLFDSYVDEPATQDQNTLTLRARDWIWIEEAQWFRHLGYDQCAAEPQRQHLFLLLMNLAKPWRDRLFTATATWHSASLVSYCGRGINISGDVDPAEGTWQRHFNREWYNNTAFSMVSESTVTERLWVSEKTFKPMAHGHAFVVYGSPGLLNYTHSLGFESWGHCIDQSYDSIVDAQQRLIAIRTVLSQLAQEFKAGQNLFVDARSREIIQHNFNHFYRQDLIKNLFLQQIIQPVQEFVNAC
jgi:hypothetical protein